MHLCTCGPGPRAYAHRGWHLDELAGPENTMAAFPRAVDEAQHSVVGLRLRGWRVQGSRAPAALTRRVHRDLAHLPHRFGGVTVVDADVLRVAHDGGREVHVWTVDDPDTMAGLLDLGVDGILTDRPDLLRALLVSRGAWAAREPT